MAFVRKKVSTVKWPVKVEEPADGGTFETSTFTAIFKRLPRSRFDKLADRGELDLLQAIMVGWEEIQDENGKAVAFTQVVLKEFADDTHWIRAVISAYTEMYKGADLGN